MPRRAVSPAASEPEMDIFGSIYPGDDTNGKQNGAANADTDFDFDGLMNGHDQGNEDDDEAFIALKQAASFRKTSNLKGRTVKKGGGFQAMGINATLLKAIARKGFSVPTPIQRKTIPLVLDRKDVVGMARTGSGKTAAFVIPMIERLRAHSAKVGSRALIMSPSRELAIQTLKVVKELSKGTDLKAVLLVGGDSLEEQFGFMAANPDIVIATPGRFLHLKVEMKLDISSIKYVVFDEADRLFEMGFAAQLTEILHALPLSRQTLLFSATLPTSLVEFARAGLQDPSLVRLDADTKVSPDLQSAYFSIKGDEKEGSLLHILHDVIKVPVGEPENNDDTGKDSKKRKRASGPARPTQHSTIVFTATKHHVEYIANLLQWAGFAVSHVYGSLDQTARRIQVEDFRHGKTNILVVTDVAARGIDIPVLANVINYDFPSQPKIFVHRVGRTARAGQRGWSYSLVRDTDAPYLLDLQLFLGKQLVIGQEKEKPSYADDVVVGSLERNSLEEHVEWFNRVIHDNDDISALQKVSIKAERLYLKTRNSASSQSAKRAREVVASGAWVQLHPLFGNDVDHDEKSRAEMMAKISGFRPNETIFEIGRSDKASNEAADVMKQLRKKITPRRRQEAEAEAEEEIDDDEVGAPAMNDFDDAMDDDAGLGAVDEDSDEDLEVTVSNAGKSKKDRDDWRDSEIFMSYTPRTVNAAEERGYGVHSGGAGSSFVEAARDVTMDLGNDESAKSFGEANKQRLRWDKKSKKYVSRHNDEDGSKGAKLVTGESGVKIAASFQSGRYDKWRKAHRIGRTQRVGEDEKAGAAALLSQGGVRYKHKQEKAPKAADKYRDDYQVRKKRVDEAREKRVGRFRDGAGSKKEIKGVHDIRKAREEKQKRKEKNARPMRKRS
ncbi:ATP-dependent RNA helicase DBP10 [Beauveria bassiana D1-5]|uniref:RNA helicase n=1 Tax=Beauveria bassiana D1-5 TaxID=1245745 RepID=A0A0A2VNV8_BEABA|nr:ATP-dependent RNA helicase DBP10 [Beauveria bassiana D1-5]